MWVSLWFLSGFVGNVLFTYRMRVGPYTAARVFESALCSFCGPLLLMVVLFTAAQEKLDEIKITKD